MADPIIPEASRRTAAEELLERVRQATIGEYEILGELGQGGMATVYVGHEIALHRKVAIKVMLPSMVYGEGMVERFKREARTAASLSHPSIIPVYTVREADGLLFFVMKLIEGTPLEAVMAELGPLPLPMVEAILGQVGSALSYAHRRGVVHRDIKPGNILIDEDGWAVVTDFGIAKVAETEGLTLTGMAVGTPTYMSPEQATGAPITGASDQYSLGIVAYEMLGGTPPFSGGSPMSLMYAHCHDPPPPLGPLRPDCPERLRVAIERMLEKEPSRRWPSMDDALGAIGLRVLAPDDPNRSQLVALARTGAARRIVSQVQTPRSPIPLGRPSRESAVAGAPAPPPARPWAWAGFGAAAVTAVGALLWLALPSGNVPPPPPVTSSTEAPAVPADTLPGVTRGAPAAIPEPASRSDDGPPAAGRRDALRAGGALVAPSPGPSRVEAPQRESVTAAADTPVTGADSAPAAAVPAPPPPPPPPPPPAAPAPSVESEVEAAIQSYARALESGDMAQVLALFPSMPADLRQGLQAFYGSGGTMRTTWRVSDIVSSGTAATARIEGVNQVRSARGSTVERVNLRARLVRTASGWRLTALVN